MRTAAVLFACGLALGAYTLNARSNDGLPDGWSLGGEAPKLFAADVDTADSPSGKGALVLRRTETSHPYGSAHLTQAIPIQSYAGKRVRIAMHVRFQDTEPNQGGIYIGTGNGGHTQGAPILNEWAWYTSTLTLPANMTRLDIGVSLKGPGSAKVDGIELTVVGDAPPDQNGTFLDRMEMHVSRTGKDDK